MLSFLNQLKSFTRTPNAALNPLILEGGRSSLELFKKETSPFFMRGTIPPRLDSEMPNATQPSSFPQQKSSQMIPPPHWHSMQDETFSVVSGRMVAILAGKQHIVDTGNEILIPTGEYHTFSNASAEEPLVVDVKLNPDNRYRDEQFFRNGYGYLDDCTKAKVNPSPFQVMLFLYSADVIPAFPGPKFLMAPLSKFIAWFAGVVIGKRLLGYKERYPEYTSQGPLIIFITRKKLTAALFNTHGLEILQACAHRLYLG